MVMLLVAASSALHASELRYYYKDADDGLIRLDRKTGEVIHCAPENGVWSCQSLGDGVAVTTVEELERTIEMLNAENEALKAENEMLSSRLGTLENELASVREADGNELPSDEELDRVFRFFDRVLERFFEFARSIQRQVGDEI